MEMYGEHGVSAGLGRPAQPRVPRRRPGRRPRGRVPHDAWVFLPGETDAALASQLRTAPLAAPYLDVCLSSRWAAISSLFSPTAARTAGRLQPLNGAGCRAARPTSRAPSPSILRWKPTSGRRRCCSGTARTPQPGTCAGMPRPMHFSVPGAARGCLARRGAWQQRGSGRSPAAWTRRRARGSGRGSWRSERRRPKPPRCTTGERWLLENQNKREKDAMRPLRLTLVDCSE